MKNSKTKNLVLDKNNNFLLFLGDASLNIYDEELKKNYLDIEEINFDFIKLSHHGSKYNISSAFINKVKCSNYFISTDGSGNHEHPHRETIAKLIINSNQNINILLNTENNSHYRWLNNLNKNVALKERYGYKIEICSFIKI